jgi:serine protease AprX
MCLKRLILCVLLTCFFGKGNAQTQYAFRVYFTDKSGADISNPISFLTQRAIDRRINHSITIDSTDVPVFHDYIDTVLTVTQGKWHVTSRWMNSFVVLLTDSSKILLLQGKPFISDIKYVGFFPGGLHKGEQLKNKFEVETRNPQPAFRTTGDPTWYGSSWGQTDLVNGDCLHDLGLKGNGVLIAVLDDGFTNVDNYPAFDSLYTSGRIKDKHNFVLDTTDVYSGQSHGTLVLSTMAAYVPNTYVGAAPLAEYALYITEDQGSEQPIELDNMIAAFERADSMGTDVISTSLGYNTFSGPTNPHPDFTYADLDGKSTMVAKAANMATAKGILMIASAGNEGNGGWHFILTPGDADSVLTIGSVDAAKQPASNSGYGPNSAGITKPDVCGLGNPAVVFTTPPNPLALSGTSFSTPQIAGFAACLLQGFPNASMYQLREAIRKSADHYSNPDTHVGYGVPDFCVAWQSLGVNDPSGFQDDWLKVYPNPWTDELRLSLNRTGQSELEIAIIDITGRDVFNFRSTVSSGHNELKIKTPQATASGVYLLRVSMGDQVQTTRLVKY